MSAIAYQTVIGSKQGVVIRNTESKVLVVHLAAVHLLKHHTDVVGVLHQVHSRFLVSAIVHTHVQRAVEQGMQIGFRNTSGIMHLYTQILHD